MATTEEDLRRRQRQVNLAQQQRGQARQTEAELNKGPADPLGAFKQIGRKLAAPFRRPDAPRHEPIDFNAAENLSGDDLRANRERNLGGLDPNVESAATAPPPVINAPRPPEFEPRDEVGPPAAPATAPSLANAGTTQVVAGGDKGPPRPPEAANRFGQFEGGVPEGFINVIRGTTSRFLPVDEEGRAGAPTQEFAATPGQTLEESQRTAQRRDPAFNIQTQDDLAQQRINIQNFSAESERLDAVFGNTQVGFDDSGRVVAAVPDPRGGGLRPIEGFTPQIDSLGDDNGRFSLQLTPGATIADPQVATIVDSQTGDTRNATEGEVFVRASQLFNNLVTRAGGLDGLSTEQLLEMYSQVVSKVGDVPKLEAAILARQ